MTERMGNPEDADFVIDLTVFDNPANPELPDRHDDEPDFYMVEDVDYIDLADSMSAEF